VLLADSFLERNGTLFQILATVAVAAVGGLVGYWLRSRNKRTKTFDFRVERTLPILFHRPANDALQVTYRNAVVQNPRIVRLNFRNTGKQVIKADEFLNPYTITVQPARLLDTAITDETAASLATHVSYGHDPQIGRVQLTVGTLNPADGFTVQMIVDADTVPQLTVSGRVEGQTRPSQIYATKADRTDTRTWFWVYAPFGVVLTLVGLFSLHYHSDKPGSVGWAVAFVVVGLLLLGLGFGMWIAARRRLKTRLLASSG
jgi:hypothetical protein